jgi:hypothetical protein
MKEKIISGLGLSFTEVRYSDNIKIIIPKTVWTITVQDMLYEHKEFLLIVLFLSI